MKNQSPLRIGITGQTGFIGTHLYNYLGLQENVERIPFKNEYFQDIKSLLEFIKSCDVIVHLAAMNRHGDSQVIYDTNIDLVNKLIASCEATKSTPYILFSSSTQEERDNLYGKSKLDGRKLLESWAQRNKANFTGLIIPNVFGPFGKPYNNSFIATFCHQLAHGEQPEIDVDGEVKLVYVGELVEEIFKVISNLLLVTSLKSQITSQKFPFTTQIKVSKVLSLLESYKKTTQKRESFLISIMNSRKTYSTHFYAILTIKVFFHSI